MTYTDYLRIRAEELEETNRAYVEAQTREELSRNYSFGFGVHKVSELYDMLEEAMEYAGLDIKDFTVMVTLVDEDGDPAEEVTDLEGNNRVIDVSEMSDFDYHGDRKFINFYAEEVTE